MNARAALPRRILAPVDFSSASRQAAASAANLALRFRARLALLHVTPPKGRPGSHGAFELAGMTSDPRQPARKKLAEFAAKDLEIEPARLVASGAASKEILKTASGWQADLILLATHGGGLARALLGSTAERVAREAPCPVLVMRGRQKRGAKFADLEEIRTILLTTDFSENSLAAFPHAAAWAREFGARIVLLYVVPEHLPVELAQIGVVLHEKQMAAGAEERLPALARKHLPDGTAAMTLVRAGPPEHMICETARELGADLIVMGSHGHTGFKRLITGSVAERVVRHAPCAVLVAREKGARE